MREDEIFQKTLYVMALCGIMFMPQMANAQATTEKAAEIQAELQKWMDRQVGLLKAYELDAEFNGKLTVTPQDSYYAAQFPYITFNSISGGRFEFGQIAANIIPNDGSNSWNVSMALPDTMKFINRNGQDTATVKISGQRFGGVWNLDYGIYTKFEAKYDGISVIDSANNNIVFTLDDLTASQNFEQNGSQNSWSGPLKLVANNLVGNIPGPYQTKITINSITSDTVYEDMPLFDYAKMESDLLSFLDNKNPSMNDISGFMTMMLEMFDHIPQDSTSDFYIRGMEITGLDAMGPTRIALDEFGFDSYMKQARTDNASLGILYGFKGLNIEGLPKEYTDYIPNDFTIDFNLAKLPMTKLLELAKATSEQALSAVEENPQQAQQMAMMTLMSIPQLLSENGTIMTVEKTGMKTPALDVKLVSEFIADVNAANKATGTATLTIDGLDQLIAKVQAMTESGAAVPQQMQMATMFLPMVQMMGQLDANGTTRTYKFEMTKDGQTLLNGTDLKNMMGARAH